MKRLVCIISILMFLFSCSCGGDEPKTTVEKQSRPEYKISYYEGEKLIKEYEAYDYCMDNKYIKLYLDKKRSDYNRVYISTGRVEIRPNL